MYLLGSVAVVFNLLFSADRTMPHAIRALELGPWCVH